MGMGYFPPATGGGGGEFDGVHNDLPGRTTANGHSIGAITNLEPRLPFTAAVAIDEVAGFGAGAFDPETTPLPGFLPLAAGTPILTYTMDDEVADTARLWESDGPGEMLVNPVNLLVTGNILRLVIINTNLSTNELASVRQITTNGSSVFLASHALNPAQLAAVEALIDDIEIPDPDLSDYATVSYVDTGDSTLASVDAANAGAISGVAADLSDEVTEREAQDDRRPQTLAQTMYVWDFRNADGSKGDGDPDISGAEVSIGGMTPIDKESCFVTHCADDTLSGMWLIRVGQEWQRPGGHHAGYWGGTGQDVYPEAFILPRPADVGYDYAVDWDLCRMNNTIIWNKKGTGDGDLVTKAYWAREFNGQHFLTPLASDFLTEAMTAKIETLISGSVGRLTGVPTFTLGAGAGTGATIDYGDSRDDYGSIVITIGTDPTDNDVVVTVEPSLGSLIDATEGAMLFLSPTSTPLTDFAPASEVLGSVSGGGTWAIITGDTPLTPTATYRWNYHLAPFLNP